MVAPDEEGVVGGCALERLYGELRLDLLDYEGAVAVDILADGEEGNASVGDAEGFEVGAREDDGLVGFLEGSLSGG